ncbi:MAG: M13 family metallopeptidase [Nevskiaceae bacterium]
MSRILAVACAALVVACGPTAERASAPPGALRSGIELENLDRAVRPQDDFYRYVNGTWLKNTPMPADKPLWAPYMKLRDDTDAQVRAIIEAAARTRGPAGSEAQQVGDLYASFMDEARIESLGATPLAAELARIDLLAGPRDIPALMARFSRLGVDSLWDGGVLPDAKDSTRYIAYIAQSGLGLPDRDYYLSDEPKFQDLRAKYVAHIERILALGGTSKPAQAAAKVMDFETRLAKLQWTRVDSRNVDKIYNRYELAKLDALTPGFGWADYLKGTSFAPSPGAVIMQPDYFTAAAKLMRSTPLPTLKAYFRWQLLHAYAPYLSKAFVDENFAYYGTALSGTPENRPRWQRGAQAVQSALGEAVGKIYVQEHFPPEAKVRMQELVANLVKAYEQSIRELDWMGEETRARALVKLSKFRPKIGYPDKWRDYSALAVRADDLVGNVMRAREYEHAYQVGKLGKPIDKDEWAFPPQTVNAFYNPLQNEIVFPAGYLQPPHFDMGADDAMNYGAIGSTIGHEIGHGFDDQGSKFDGDGNLQSWWTADDRANFEARTRQLIEQYNAYCPLPDLCLNGALTIGENIGDLGGVSIAYRAWKIALAGREPAVIDGLTGEQRFFMGFAQSERSLIREEFLVRMVKSDPHAPGEYRCNGVLTNVPEFYAAFGVKDGDKMYAPPEKRVKIW